MNQPPPPNTPPSTFQPPAQTGAIDSWKVLAKKRLEDLTLFTDRIEVQQRKRRNPETSTIPLSSVRSISTEKAGIGKMALVLTVGAMPQSFPMASKDAQAAAQAINSALIAL